MSDWCKTEQEQSWKKIGKFSFIRSFILMELKQLTKMWVCPLHWWALQLVQGIMKTKWGPGEMGSLSRPEFTWLLNRLRADHKSLRHSSFGLVFCCNDHSTCGSALQTNLTSSILLGALLRNQLLYLNSSHQHCCYETSLAVSGRNDL